MATHPLHDEARKIHDAFASEPRRSWLLDRLREWHHDPDARPYWPPRAIEEVDLDDFLPTGEPVPDRERPMFSDQEIAFAFAAIHDAYLSSLMRQTNTKVEPLVERDGELWKQLVPYYGLRWAFERNATSDDWDEGRRKRLGDMISQAVAASATDDLGGTSEAAKGSKRSGRPKADRKTIEREAKLKADWERARDASPPTLKSNFASENGYNTVEEFDALLDRVSKRQQAVIKEKSRSE